MISELNEVLTSVLGTIAACGGVGGAWAWRHNKKMRSLERQLKDTEVNKARIEGKTDEWHFYKEQLDVCNARIIEMQKNQDERDEKHREERKELEERWHEQILRSRTLSDEYTSRMATMQDELLAAADREKEHLKRESQLEQRCLRLLRWVCKKDACDDGIPPRDRLKGHDFDSDMAEDVEDMHPYESHQNVPTRAISLRKD